MKLCMVANPNSVHVHRWMQHFIERGDVVHLIGAKPLYVDLPDGLFFHDAAAFTRVRKIQYAVRALATRQIVQSIAPDIVHAHFVDGGGWLGAAAGFHPFLVTAYGSDLLVAPKCSWLYRTLARWVLSRADHAICWSPLLAQEAQALGMSSDKISVLHNGIDTAVFAPSSTSAAAVRIRFNLAPGPIVVSLRAMQPIYNPLDIARAIPVVLRAVPHAQFVVLTYRHQPALLAEFQAIVHDAGAADSVRYVGGLGTDQELAQLLQIADVAISAASSDGTPMSVLEAMSCGVALVLGKIPAFESWVAHEENGLLVPLHDVQALGAAIVRLLTDRQLRQHLSMNGMASIEENGTRRIMMQRAEKLYEFLL